MINLEPIIVKIYEKRKNLLGLGTSYILGHTFIKYGFVKMLILALFVIVGYNYEKILIKTTQVIKSRLDERGNNE